VIARHRGDLRTHSRWRPGGQKPPAARPTPGARPRRLRRAHAIWLLAAIATAVALTLALTERGGASTSLPATPRQWVNAWAAAAVDDPGRICHTLYAPALAAVYKPDTGKTCMAYFSNTSSPSFRIRHVLVDGDAAAVEARETGQRPHWGYFTMLLSHVDGGWKAIDIVPGGPAR
jgi:hypothetical protein